MLKYHNRLQKFYHSPSFTCERGMDGYLPDEIFNCENLEEAYEWIKDELENYNEAKYWYSDAELPEDDTLNLSYEDALTQLALTGYVNVYYNEYPQTISIYPTEY